MGRSPRRGGVRVDLRGEPSWSCASPPVRRVWREQRLLEGLDAADFFVPSLLPRFVVARFGVFRLLATFFVARVFDFFAAFFFAIAVSFHLDVDLPLTPARAGRLRINPSLSSSVLRSAGTFVRLTVVAVSTRKSSTMICFFPPHLPAFPASNLRDSPLGDLLLDMVLFASF